MTNTTKALLRKIERKPWKEYNLDELQEYLQEIFNLYRRFKHEDDRKVLNQEWGILAATYNDRLRVRFDVLNNIYPNSLKESL